MSFWDLSDPMKPLGEKSKGAKLDFPISFRDWLADVNDAYANHTVEVSGGITLEASSESNGVITVDISGGQPGRVASFTVRIQTRDGRRDERTFYLKIVQR